MKLKLSLTALLLIAAMLSGCALSNSGPVKPGGQPIATNTPAASTLASTPTPTTTPTATPAATPTPEPAQVANILLLSPKYKSAPFFDAKTKKKAGQIYPEFALPIESQKDGNGWFTVSIDDNDNPVNREFYIPIQYLTKGYMEPQSVIKMISLDTIVLHAGASVYDQEGKAMAKFAEKLGPIHFIQKTDKGYQLVMGFNVVYIHEKDAVFIKYKK